MGILDKIAEIENEIARTQKNKATEYHLGLLKAKLAKYRSQLLETQEKSSGKGEGFDVMKSGDARVALIGFPSVGKSTLLNSLTSTHSECASYEFTTLTCIPGVIEYNGANIQLLDLPGIIEGASQDYVYDTSTLGRGVALLVRYGGGPDLFPFTNALALKSVYALDWNHNGKGRGRQVIAVARTADLVIIMLDATKPDIHRTLLERELEAVGIRLNKRKPNIYFKQKKTGGLKITSMVPLTRINEKMTQMILQEYKIFNAEVIFREDCTPDEFIDVVSGNRVYMGCLYVYNKIDQISLQEVDRLAREPHSVVVSCNLKLNLDYLLEKLWEHLDLIQVYTKKRGERPDLEEGLILRNGATVEHVCHMIHRSLVSQFKCALVWGSSVKFSPQHVGLNHVMHHHDVIQVIKK